MDQNNPSPAATDNPVSSAVPSEPTPKDSTVILKKCPVCYFEGQEKICPRCKMLMDDVCPKCRRVMMDCLCSLSKKEGK